MTDNSDRQDGYYGCSRPPGACGCPQDARHKCTSAHWIATPPTRDGAEGAGKNEIHSSDGGVGSQTRKELSADAQSLLAAGNVDSLGVAPGPSDFSSTPPKPAPDAMRLTDRELYDNSCITRHQLADWVDSDYVAHVGGLKHTIEFLLARLDALSSVPPADGATEDALTKLLDETWPDGHRAAARKILSRFSISPAVAAEPVSWPPYIELPLTFWYKNHRGEESLRTAFPIGIRFGATEWHPEAQWLLKAFDRDKQAEREFAMRDMLASPTVRGDREAIANTLDQVAQRMSKIYLSPLCAYAMADAILSLPIQPGAGERWRSDLENFGKLPLSRQAPHSSGERES